MREIFIHALTDADCGELCIQFFCAIVWLLRFRSFISKNGRHFAGPRKIISHYKKKQYILFFVGFCPSDIVKCAYIYGRLHFLTLSIYHTFKRLQNSKLKME